MAIELPGYTDVFKGTAHEDQVFSRDAQITAEICGQTLPLRVIIAPKRYTRPTTEEVAAYLQKKAQEVEGASLLVLPTEAQQERSELEQAIIALPPQIRSDIIRRDQKIMKFLAANSFARELPAQYLQVQYGLLQPEIIDSEQAEGRITDPSWYEGAFSHDGMRESGQGQRWGMLLLLSDWSLPKKSEIDILLKHETYSSGTFNVVDDYDSFEDVKGVVETLYAGLSSAEQILQFKDVSSDVLESFALSPLRIIHKRLRETSLRQKNLLQIMMGGGTGPPMH